MTFDEIALAASILCVAVAWAPSAAHLFEMRAKLRLPRDEYLVTQQIYQGWALFGFAVGAALLTTGWFAWTARGSPWFVPALTSFLCVALTQVVFWTRTAPANRETDDWTRLPDGWEALRSQWERSHAVSAALNLLALVSLLIALVLRLGSIGA